MIAFLATLASAATLSDADVDRLFADGSDAVWVGLPQAGTPVADAPAVAQPVVAAAAIVDPLPKAPVDAVAALAPVAPPAVAEAVSSPGASVPLNLPDVTSGGSPSPWWLVGAMALAGGAFAWRSRRKANVDEPGVRVVARTRWSPQAGVVVIEVDSANGERIRYLVADGTAPAFLYEIGRVSAPPVAAAPRPAPVVVSEPEVDEGDDEHVEPEASDTGDFAARLAAARSLVDEVVAERRREEPEVVSISAARGVAASRYRNRR